MSDFVRGDCHKCKFEITAECVPRSQKMGFPNCYQSTTTNADRIRGMSDEELAHFFYNLYSTMIAKDLPPYIAPSKEEWLDWLKQGVEA